MTNQHRFDSLAREGDPYTRAPGVAIEQTGRRERGLWSFLTWSFFLSQALAAYQPSAEAAAPAHDGAEGRSAVQHMSERVGAGPAVLPPILATTADDVPHMQNDHGAPPIGGELTPSKESNLDDEQIELGVPAGRPNGNGHGADGGISVDAEREVPLPANDQVFELTPPFATPPDVHVAPLVGVRGELVHDAIHGITHDLSSAFDGVLQKVEPVLDDLLGVINSSLSLGAADGLFDEIVGGPHLVNVTGELVGTVAQPPFELLEVAGNLLNDVLPDGGGISLIEFGETATALSTSLAVVSTTGIGPETVASVIHPLDAPSDPEDSNSLQLDDVVAGVLDTTLQLEPSEPSSSLQGEGAVASGGSINFASDQSDTLEPTDYMFSHSIYSDLGIGLQVDISTTAQVRSEPLAHANGPLSKDDADTDQTITAPPAITENQYLGYGI